MSPSFFPLHSLPQFTPLSQRNVTPISTAVAITKFYKASSHRYAPTPAWSPSSSARPSMIASRPRAPSLAPAAMDPCAWSSPGRATPVWIPLSLLWTRRAMPQSQLRDSVCPWRTEFRSGSQRPCKSPVVLISLLQGCILRTRHARMPPLLTMLDSYQVARGPTQRFSLSTPARASRRMKWLLRVWAGMPSVVSRRDRPPLSIHSRPIPSGTPRCTPRTWLPGQSLEHQTRPASIRWSRMMRWSLKWTAWMLSRDFLDGYGQIQMRRLCASEVLTDVRHLTRRSLNSWWSFRRSHPRLFLNKNAVLCYSFEGLLIAGVSCW